MKIVTNEKLIKRNARIGSYTTIAALAILGIGLYISFNQMYIQWSFLALLVGFILSQVGIFFGSRWGRSPRPDEKLTQALKGLSETYTLYHYTAPVNHLLVGPAGVWVLIPYQQKGVITYDEGRNRWKQQGGNLYLKIFAQEGLGRPDMEIKSNELDMENFIKKQLGDTQMPVKSVVVFTSDKVTVDAPDAPVPTLHVDKLKDFIRRKAKETPASLETVQLIQKTLPTESQ